jgi:hypothetical protein
MILPGEAGLWRSYKLGYDRRMRAEKFGVHCGYCFYWVQIVRR